MLACLREDTNQLIHAASAPPPALNNSLLENLHKLRESLGGEVEGVGNPPMQHLVRYVLRPQQLCCCAFARSSSVSFDSSTLMLRLMNGHLLLARLFKFLIRTSPGKSSCGAPCRLLASLATTVDSFCHEHSENQRVLRTLMTPHILEYHQGTGTGTKKACSCDNSSLLQVRGPCKRNIMSSLLFFSYASLKALTDFLCRS